MTTIAIDAMGGDRAPEVIVEGVARVSRETDIQCVLVGDRRRVQALLEAESYRPENVTIVHAPTAVTMDESPKAALEAKKDCSLLVGARLVAEGRADALVSAGNTGACVLACASTFRRIRGIRKTALATVFPRKIEHAGQDRLALLLDVGATIRCETDDLVHFGIMGSAYARCVSRVARPRVGLLNIGEEPYKGGPVVSGAHARLAAIPELDFVGNVEGHDVAKGKADVLVCEGFVGNVVVKLLEGFSEVVIDVASFAANESLLWRAGLALLGTGIRQLRDLTDYASYGGAPILGFEHLFLKAHGRSDARAIANAVKVAAKASRDDVVGEITSTLRAMG